MKEFTCIICPRGCELRVENSIYEVAVSGNHCRRGYKYALQEYTNPVRTVTLNVRVIGGTMPVVSAKTAEEVPLSKVMTIAHLLKKQTVNAPVDAGDILFKSLMGTDIISTKSINKAE